MAVKAVCVMLSLLAISMSSASSYMIFEEGNHSNHSHPNSSAYHGGYPSVHTPHTWICLTTAGGINATGGNINKKWCGESCQDSSTAIKDISLGVFGAILAIVLFGSNFIPVKKYDTGDGMFFQWVVCIGIWLVGLVVNLARSQPPLFLPSIVGGIFWCTGNLLVVPVVKMIGLTMGLTVWGVTNMLNGWFQGKVLLKEYFACDKLNYAGVVTVIISVAILAFVKSEGKSSDKPSDTEPASPSERTSLLNDKNSSLEGSLRERVLQKNSSGSIQNNPKEQLTFSPNSVGSGTESVYSNESVDADFSWVDRLGVWPKRIVGFSLALLAGLLYGFLFLPVGYLKLCNDGAHSCVDMDYLFGVYCGILLASTTYFFIYSLVKCNQPVIYPKVIIPGLISGILWGIAMLGWFLANQYLSLAIAFPIVTAGPGFVSSAWGILLYREIKGWRNLIIYFSAFAVTCCGLTMDGLSRCTVKC